MDSQTAIDLGREALMLALLISAPILLVGAGVGLIVGLLQALTQVQDQTVAFVPKIVAMVLALSFCMPWVLQQLLEYSQTLISNIPRVISGG
ncbi:MAG: flagellar biosynthesis protein FliQ [Planctomycetes bacterium]|nr:flagellar biosynthesis protein FliQ [Planctomycetota bacterium]